MNLMPDTCKDYEHAASWIPGKLTACIYTHKSVSDFLMDVFHDKARQHYNRSLRLGYVTRRMEWEYRNDRLEDIRQINISMPERQGRAMHPSYSDPYVIYPGKQCPHHYVDLILCCDKDGTIVAYLEWYKIGEFSYTSRILGHAGHLKNGIMYAIINEFYREAQSAGCKVIVYGEWLSGTAGLQFFKKQCGFKPVKLL